MRCCQVWRSGRPREYLRGQAVSCTRAAPKLRWSGCRIAVVVVPGSRSLIPVAFPHPGGMTTISLIPEGWERLAPGRVPRPGVPGRRPIGDPGRGRSGAHHAPRNAPPSRRSVRSTSEALAAFQRIVNEHSDRLVCEAAADFGARPFAVGPGSGPVVAGSGDPRPTGRPASNRGAARWRALSRCRLLSLRSAPSPDAV
jgi:hypothetical protein